ncbi:hypothetical protein AWB80_04420 [Caballeronia pedi]|uniref:Uncharacterized protein n=1 Tax=Caballeronia pedi TaxID=1777141 RepID=A0A158C1B3_9BURK|nr:hypothetical protein [Caballeronia pedi]SAK76051.1 hypothetical protein AWB80_04420 [Caballeronia pedi]
MKLEIENQGDTDVRVIVDRDTVNDSMLEPGEAKIYETLSEGVIELRELGDAEQDG